MSNIKIFTIFLFFGTLARLNCAARINTPGTQIFFNESYSSLFVLCMDSIFVGLEIVFIPLTIIFAGLICNIIKESKIQVSKRAFIVHKLSCNSKFKKAMGITFVVLMVLGRIFAFLLTTGYCFIVNILFKTEHSAVSRTVSYTVHRDQGANTRGSPNTGTTQGDINITVVSPGAQLNPGGQIVKESLDVSKHTSQADENATGSQQPVIDANLQGNSTTQWQEGLRARGAVVVTQVLDNARGIQLDSSQLQSGADEQTGTSMQTDAARNAVTLKTSDVRANPGGQQEPANIVGAKRPQSSSEQESYQGAVEGTHGTGLGLTPGGSPTGSAVGGFPTGSPRDERQPPTGAHASGQAGPDNSEKLATRSVDSTALDRAPIE